MASITKRNNTFRIRVSLGYDHLGNQITKSTTFVPPTNVTSNKARKLAEEFAFEYERKCKGLIDLKENMRFCDLMDWYFENYADNELKDITSYNYKSQLNYHVIPEFGNMKLKDFTPAKITAFFKKKNLSHANSKKIYIIMQSLFTRAVEQGFIKETPCRNVILPKDKEQKEKKPFLNEVQAKTLLDMVKDYSPFNIIIKLLLYTGMRSGEALGLRWQDIDFENKVIRIEHTLTDVAGKHWLTTPKTANSKRIIGMSEVLSNILLEHKEKQEEQVKKLGKMFTYPEMIFTSATGNYLDRSGLNQKFRRFVKDTDFDFLTLHGLRHCNATLLINNGIDIKLVSEHLGHSDINVTANVYADVLMSSKVKMAEAISLKLD